jgi:predicted O-methyltransferase YrrM
MAEAADFEKWLAEIRKLTGRPRLSDQTVESMRGLSRLVRDTDPRVIVELGTGYGLSLRTFLAASDVQVVTVDRSHGGFRASQRVLPLSDDDKGRVALLEANVLDIERVPWYPWERVLLYVDVHGQDVMKHIIEHMVMTLPSGSIVCVDDLWYSEKRLTAETASQFYEMVVKPTVDPKAKKAQTRLRHYADYWSSGSFFGFSEIYPLMEWINRNRMWIQLVGTQETAKQIWFEV